MAQVAKQVETKAAPVKGGKKAEPQKLPTTVPELRTELAKARRDHTLQQLESPIRLRQLQRALARALGTERAKAAAAKPAEAKHG